MTPREDKSDYVETGCGCVGMLYSMGMVIVAVSLIAHFGVWGAVWRALLWPAAVLFAAIDWLITHPDRFSP